MQLIKPHVISLNKLKLIKFYRGKLCDNNNSAVCGDMHIFIPLWDLNPKKTKKNK